MKTPVAPIWIAGLVLAMAWLPNGLAQNETHRPLTSAPDATPAVTPARPATGSSPRALTSPLELPSAPIIPLTNDATIKDRRPPSKIKLSPWAAEMVKLAEARIGDDVMYSFIDNSGTFNLGADQIVYLSDLGVPSQIISAMLQHDQELVSGVRPLTIASEPAYEPILPERIAVSSYPLMTSPRAAVLSAPAVPVTAGATVTPDVKPSPEINRSFPDVQPAALPSPKTDDLVSALPPALSAQRLAAARKKSLYPVREPQPVELTAPIIFIAGEDRPPNTIIIVGFPRAEPPAP
jgi:hypothetical protein